MTSNLSNVINYCRIINGSKGFNDTKTQFTNEITQDYNMAREDTVYRFDVLVNSIDAKDVYINDLETPIKGVIDVKKKQTADTEMEETLQVYPNQIKQGDYVKFKVNDTDTLRTYIIKSKIEKKHGYDEGIFEECNHKFKWMYKNVLHEAYGIGTNQTKYTLGTDSVQAGIVESDSRYAIDFPNCIKCKTIKVGQRFIFNEGAWKVTKVEYVSSQDNIRSILLGQDNINSEIDDVDNEIAGKWANKHTYTYNIPINFEVANGNDYILNYSIKDEVGKDFDYSLVTSTTTNNTLVSIINNKGIITIKGIGIGTGSIKLSVPIGETTKDFDINFEVKAVVADKIEYKYKFSQGTTLKQYVSTLVEFTKIVGAIPDINLLVNYTIDSNGSSLLNSNSISITRKTNTSFLIKNININTSKSFVITFVDNSDNKVILSQVINLTKGL